MPSTTQSSRPASSICLRRVCDKKTTRLLACLVAFSFVGFDSNAVAESVQGAVVTRTEGEAKLMIKKVSRFMTGSDQDSIVPIPVIVCSSCGHVNEMFKPKV